MRPFPCRSTSRLWTAVALSACLFLLITACGVESSSDKKDQKKSSVAILENEAAFDKALKSAAQKLVMVEFFADWCAPCRELAPILEEISKNHRDSVLVYKVNVDENSELAQRYRIRGIPLVLFFKQSEVKHTMLGLYPKANYVDAITQYR